MSSCDYYRPIATGMVVHNLKVIYLPARWFSIYVSISIPVGWFTVCE